MCVCEVNENCVNMRVVGVRLLHVRVVRHVHVRSTRA